MHLFSWFTKTSVTNGKFHLHHQLPKVGRVCWLNVIMTEVPVEVLQSVSAKPRGLLPFIFNGAAAVCVSVWLKKNITEVIRYLVQYRAAYQCNSAL